MKSSIYFIIVFLVTFVVAIGLFRYWIDTIVYVNKTCMHVSIGTAELVEKHLYPKEPLNEAGFPATCVYRVNSSDKIETHYYSHCGYKEIGSVIDWRYANYSCDNLINTNKK